MKPQLYLAAFQAAAGALLSVLSRRVYLRLRDEPFWTYWALYWLAVCVFHTARAGSFYIAAALPMAIVSGVSAAAAPALLAMAAWCVTGRKAGTRAWVISASLILPTVAGYAVLQAPVAPSYLLQSGLMIWFTVGFSSRLREGSWSGRWITLFFCSAYAAHLAVDALGVSSVPVPGGPASLPALGIDAFLIFGICLGLVVTLAESAALAESRIDSLWDGSRDGMRLTDGEGVIRRVNPAFCSMMGLTREQLEGQLFSCCYHASEHAHLLQGYRQRVAKGEIPSRLERELRLWDDRQTWFELSNSMLPSPAGDMVLSVFRDITERKLAENGLRRRERQLEVLSRASQLVNTVLEAGSVWRTLVTSAIELTGASGGSAGIMQDGCMVFTEYCRQGRMTPVSATFGPGQGASGAVIFNQRPFVANYLSEGKQADLVFPGVPPPACVANIPVVGQVGRLLGCVEIHGTAGKDCFDEQDVVMLHGLCASAAVALQNAEHLAEQRTADDALRASEGRYRLITGNSTDMITTHDPDGVYTFVSPACRRLLGLEPEELVGRNAFELIHDQDIALTRAAETARQTGTAERPVSNRLARKDGSWVWVETVARVVRDEETGQVIEIIAVSRDITQRLELEAQFRQAQKLEGIGRLAGGVAHDFNNILTVINGYAAMLTQDLDAGAPAREIAQEILAAGERAAGLTQQLLAFSRKQMQQPQVIDLNRLISEAQRMLQRVVGEDVEFNLLLASDAGTVHADPSQMQQVLMNLVVNARDAMPGGGRLTIATAVRDWSDGNGMPTGLKAGRYVSMSVIDTGSGMDEETRGQIFEPFFTTKDASRGSGLGLSTVFGIVRQSGGHIQVESVLGAGSTFHIYLPCAGQPSPVEAPLQESTAAPRGWETVMVVEDQPEVRRLTSRLLTGDGYVVLEARNGDEALSVCEGFNGTIHLTITDVIMPGMNGRVLSERLKQLRPEMKLLFISGYTNNALQGQALVDPSMDYLPKPFTPQGLLERVHKILDAPRPCRTILVVDDEPGVRRLLRRVIESAGYRVLEAANGHEALSIVRQKAVDLIVTDLVMPEKEGLETIRELRTTHPQAKVIAMSGALDGKFLKAAAALGVWATLKKPVAAEELLKTLEQVLAASPR